MTFRKILSATLLAVAATTAAPANAANTSASATINVVKPVLLTKLNDLNFGTVTFSGGSSGTGTVSISQAGVVTCTTGALCTGAVAAAGFNVQGTNKMTVLITVPTATLSNGSDTMTFTPNAPASVYLPNSGSPGVNFNIGGSVAIGAANLGGTYTGNISVTADYQ